MAVFCICQSDFSFLHFNCSLYLLVKFGLFSDKEVLRCGHDELSVKTWKKKTHRKKEWGKHFPDFFSTFNSFWIAKDIPWLFPDHVRLSVWVTGKSISLPSPRHFFTISPNRLSRRQKTVVRRWTSPPPPIHTYVQLHFSNFTNSAEPVDNHSFGSTAIKRWNLPSSTKFTKLSVLGRLETNVRCPSQVIAECN